MNDENSLRERLIDVGVDLVLTEGSASVGLREIARRAGVSHGAPRRYFATHHALLAAIAQRGFEDLAARFEGADDREAPPRVQLERIAGAYVGYALERRGMFELMFRHDLLDGAQQEAGRPQLRTSTLPLFMRMVELVGLCRKDPDAVHRPDSPGSSAVSPAVTAAALWSGLHGIAQLWTWGSLQLALGTPPPGDQERDRLVTAVLDAHLAPVTA
ncbi:TetR family transcriptional regulator [Streptomyces sp. CB01635]|uniref:TetR/AcrR family transcriptional regulator n=1 Tax=unclassified Streptomyces TaxID=2593676 RepID=UPI000C273087|nr:TetR/AcrR family transcriptional regulator [Streptomyces sp. CB01635]PJN10194.1 TetR family transcriptional regulator [Streptomyces sp. CB01635]